MRVAFTLVGSAAALSITQKATNVMQAFVGQAPEPLFTKDTMPKTPVAMECIINLCVQYFLVYTAIAVCRTVNQMYGTWGGALKMFSEAAKTVTYCPMLSVLLLGARMRAQQLTQGETDKYGLPTKETQSAMRYAAWAVAGQVIMVLAMPFVLGDEVPLDEDGNVDVEALKGKVSTTMVSILSAIRYAILALLYGATIYVVYGIHTMVAPVEVYPEGTPKVSPAVGATINLTSQFFIIYALGAILKTCSEFGYGGPTHQKLTSGTAMATLTVNMAPMLSILFIGARMRALQIDPKHGSPQPWAQNCFWICTYGIMVQALLCIALPFCGGRVVKGDFEGDVKFEGMTGAAASFLTFVRYACLIGVYAGFSVVVYSVFVIKNKQDPALTPPLSPAMMCVMNLVFQYFGCYLVLFLAQTIRNYAWEKAMTTTASVMADAVKTVMYAPMLSVLFVGARMRSLQLARASDGSMPQNAGPPLWVQDCMFLSTWAVLVQVLLVIGLGVMYNGVQMDADGNVETPKDVSPAAGYVMNFLRYASMIAMYGGSSVICYGMVVMTPETVQPYSQENLIPGVKVPGPPTPDKALESVGSVAGAVGSVAGAF